MVAVVITLGLTGSRWLSSYKRSVKAEGKHRHQNNKKLSHRNVVIQRCREGVGERACWGKSPSSQCKVIKPRERQSITVKSAEEGKQSSTEMSVD